jgi:hypothetical protein
MFGKEFFVNRYRMLGWEFRDVMLRPAIRINVMNVGNMDIVGRLSDLGVKLEKDPVFAKWLLGC